MLDRRIGAQLYTVRELCRDAKGLDTTLERLAGIGYKTLQVSGIGPIPAEEIKAICDSHGMEIICTHRSLEDYETRMDEMIAFHKTLGVKLPGIGSMFSLCEVKTAEEARAQIERLNVIARRLKQEGMTFCYHNHAFEFAKLDGRYLMDYLLEYGEFDFILDVYWLAYAGQDPAAFIRRIGSRAKIIHFKDLKMKGNTSVFGEVMEGNLDWDAIISASDEAGALAAMVEQDTCDGDPVESMAVSYRNLKTKGFF